MPGTLDVQPDKVEFKKFREWYESLGSDPSETPAKKPRLGGG